MWTSILRFFVGAKNFSPLRIMTWVLIALLLAACAWIYVQGLRMDAIRADAARQITAEQAAHDATRSALDQAMTNIARLQATLDAAHNSTSALQDSLRNALAREADAVTAAAARKQILDQMRTRTRTEPETLEVIDDDTRRAVTDRLNRPL